MKQSLLPRAVATLVGVVLLLPSVPLFAQDTEHDAAPLRGDQVNAVISGPDDIAVGRTIILDASASRVIGEKNDYIWTVEETRQTLQNKVEAIYTPERPGVLTFKLVLKSRGLDGQTQQAIATHTVTVYKRKIALIADSTIPNDKLTALVAAANENNVYLRVAQPEQDSGPLGSEDALLSVISEQKSLLANAEATVIWSDGIAGLQALVRALQPDPDRLATITNQTIVLVTDRSLSALGRTARAAFSSLKPKQIIITRREAVNPLIVEPGVTEFMKLLADREIEHTVLTKSSVGYMPWDVLSSLVNFLLTHGVSSQTVILLLLLPIIATIIAFLKQIVGLTTFGLYTPSIIALSMLALGWWVGTVFLILIIAVGYATRQFMRRWRMLYIPKVAIILTVLSISLLILIAAGSAFGITLTRDSVFILLIMSTLSETFLNMKTEEGWLSAIMAVGETIVASLLCVWIVQRSTLQGFILAYPEFLLLTIGVNALLGRFTGLRLVEYFRFREVMKHLQEE